MRVVTALPSPEQLKLEFCAPHSFITKSRESARAILERKDRKLALIIGPCSVHDPAAALEYGRRLQQLGQAVESSFFLIMRLFIEKPRTLTGWKGMLYDPFLDGSNDIATGLQTARQLWTELACLGIPCAMELLDPLVVPYFDDLIVWGMIGARTSASQPHRQLASGLSFPVGFKNDYHGQIDTAIAGVLSSRARHSHLGLGPDGIIAAIATQGNPLTHLVLRGAEHHTNFDRTSVATAIEQLELYGLEPRLLIDCSHGNSGKDYKKQKIAFEAVLEQIVEGNESIAGLMLESHLHAGKQPIIPPLHYGVSVTDSCLSWEESEALILKAHERLETAKLFY